MNFEWHSKKAEGNWAKHGVTFELARRAFDDPFALMADDEKHSTKSEVREWLIGEADGVVLVVIFTRRNSGAVYRLISARKASRREREIYEKSKGIPL